ncbi:MAG: carbohydrate kinase, partial [Bacteroidetes bacterium]
MYLLGIDLGSSSVKVSLVEGDTGHCVASAYQPQREMPMIAKKMGWAEQEPALWWRYVQLATREVLKLSGVNGQEVAAVGISYQMHGLVLVDKDFQVLRPSIIWCDSRAAEIGEQAFHELGEEKCLTHLLNSPGNFTASKLKWVKDNEPEIYARAYKMLLPGDYLALKLTGEPATTVSGLSEGIMWDFQEEKPADFLLEYFGIDPALIPDIVPTFGEQGKLGLQAADELGLKVGIPVAYRAGDQPNNGFSLNVLQPGEIAATAGTSGVVYGVSSKVTYDKFSRVNTFAHVNHKKNAKRLGVLLCVNGSGILNSWMYRNIGQGNLTYDQMNLMASDVPIG